MASREDVLAQARPGYLGALAPENLKKPRPKPPFDMTGTWYVNLRNGTHVQAPCSVCPRTRLTVLDTSQSFDRFSSFTNLFTNSYCVLQRESVLEQRLDVLMAHSDGVPPHQPCPNHRPSFRLCLTYRLFIALRDR